MQKAIRILLVSGGVLGGVSALFHLTGYERPENIAIYLGTLLIMLAFMCGMIMTIRTPKRKVGE